MPKHQESKVIKIFNIKSKRMVLANGSVAKQLYKEYLEGKVKLDMKDVEILKSIYDPERNIFKSKYINVYKLSDFSDIHKIKTQGTSRIFNGYLGGELCYIKELNKQLVRGVTSLDLAINEVLASVIYRHIYKVPAIELFLVINDDNKKYQNYMVASKAIVIDTCEPITKNCYDLLQNKIEGALEPLLVDCIMANWDIGSRGNIGIITEPKKKYAFRIDVGGSLLYRALGERRNYVDIPTEHKTFFEPQNKGFKLFKNITTKQLSKAYDIIKKVKDPESTYKRLLNDFKKYISIYIQDETRKQKALYIIESAIQTALKRHIYYIQNEKVVREEISCFIRNL